MRKPLSTGYLDSLFDDLPAARALHREIQEFYGNAFKTWSIKSPDGQSRFGLETDQAALKFKSAFIEINTYNSRRIAAAAVHELLHLQLPVRGFVGVRSLNPTPTQEPVMDDILAALNKVTNVVQHDIFFNDFVRIGLPPELFLTERREKDTYEKTSRDPLHRTIPEGLEWPLWGWWSLEYLRHQISIEHCPQYPAAALAESVAKWGCKALPGFDRTVAKIQLWIRRGDHRQPETYPKAFRTLAGLTHLPQIRSFYVLKQATGDGPHMEVLN